MWIRFAFSDVALLFSFLQLVSSQQLLGGHLFLSLDCGGDIAVASYQDQSVPDVMWKPDRTYIPTGIEGTITAAISAVPRHLQSLRFFPAGSSPAKNCFALPVDEDSTYLIRAGFLYGNYDNLQSAEIDFQMALDNTVLVDLTISGSSSSVAYYEMIIPEISQGTSTVSLCLIRTGSAAPFINSLELRQLNSNMYGWDFGYKPFFLLLNRVNFGATTSLRYPDDQYDRIWPPGHEVFPALGGKPISAPPGQVIDNTSNISAAIPSAVLATAVSGQVISYARSIPFKEVLHTFSYYAELNATKALTDRRIMEQTDNFGSDIYTFEFPRPFVGYGLGYNNYTPEVDDYNVTWTRDVSSTLDALVCADELYMVKEQATGTLSDDVVALYNLKSAYNLTHWVGDPCKPVPWDELTCADSPTYSRVTSLDLSGKNLRGNIPASIITSFKSLKNLTLSNNNFTGAIPSSLQTLEFLTVLNVSGNDLLGGLETWMTSLTTLDVSNNQLDGTFPASLLALPVFRYSGNPLLQCVQVGNGVCSSQPPPPGAPPPLSAPPPPGAPPPPSAPPDGSSSSIVPIVGGIAAAAIVVAIVAGVSIWCIWCRKPKTTPSGTGAGGLVVVGKDASMSLSREAVKIATMNYAQQIGEGGFGPVFHGELTNKQEVAVKILSGKSRQGSVEFFNEISLLSTIHHRNLVSLVGYCHDPPDLILLYEYMSGGDLSQRLYGAKSSPPLSWLERLSIALDAAKGLQYLHDGCKKGIIHRDVKTSNILLTNKMEAKLADFGLSKLKAEGDSRDPLVTKIQGTVGYLDPEYSSTGFLTERSDVYSFGVVLMEILTGLPVYAPDGAGPPQDRYIVNRVQNAVNAGSVERVVDRGVGSSYTVESAWILAETALGCTRPSGAARPNISRVVGELTRAVEKENYHKLSYASSSLYSDNSNSMTDITFRHQGQPLAR